MCVYVCVYVRSLCPQLDVEQNIVKLRLNQDGNIVEGTEVVAGTPCTHIYTELGYHLSYSGRG